MRKVLLVLMLLLPVGIPAQEKKEEPKTETVSKVFEVKPGNVERIAAALRSLLGGGAVTANREVGMVVVRTQREMMPAVEQVIRRLDTTVPAANNVEITVYLVEASREPLPGAGNIPPDLQPTVTQLRNIFAYQNFQLLDTAVLRSRSGQTAQINGILSFGKDMVTPYRLRLRPTVQADEKTRSVRIDDLEFSTQIRLGTPPAPGETPRVPYGLTEARINADIDVKENQKVVVGKTGLEGGGRALILVLSGKIVD